MSSKKSSVIIAACNEGENLADTVGCILENTEGEFEVIVVDDGSADGCGQRVRDLFGADKRVSVSRTQGLGVACARNVGAQAATGEVLVFLDGHCYLPPGWLDLLRLPLEDPSVGLVGPSFASLLHQDEARGFGVTWQDASLEMRWLAQMDANPYPIPLLPGGCDVLRRRDFERLGGYDSGMTRWGSEGQELSLRAWLMGHQVVVQPQVVVYHLFRNKHPYQVDMAKVLYNRLRMALLHLRPERVHRILEFHKNFPGFSESLLMLLNSDVKDRRQQLDESRRYRDDWFFDRFGMQI